MLAVALPNAGLLQVGDVIGRALRTLHHAIGPAKGYHLRLAILETAEVDDSLLKCFDAVHVLIMAVFHRSVKYIIALVSAPLPLTFQTYCPLSTTTYSPPPPNLQIRRSTVEVGQASGLSIRAKLGPNLEATYDHSAPDGSPLLQHPVCVTKSTTIPATQSRSIPYRHTRNTTNS